MSDAKLILIDGTAVLYRAFYAIRELSTEAGRPTNAVFGFVRMLRQVRETWAPTHWLVVFDGGLPAERLALMETYKAQRPAMPASLREQGGTVQEYLDRADIAWMRREGQEADDLLASVAAWAGPGAESILIATNDKDLFQLVDDKVRIVAPTGKGDVLDADGIRAKTGVGPRQIVEWLALVGDASDNIPGVPGVGAKTAAKLINEYGSLDRLWAGLDRMKGGRVRDALARHRAIVERNLLMVRLRADLDPRIEWEDLAVKEPEPRKLLPLLKELEFGSMVKEYSEPVLF